MKWKWINILSIILFFIWMTTYLNFAINSYSIAKSEELSLKILEKNIAVTMFSIMDIDWTSRKNKIAEELNVFMSCESTKEVDSLGQVMFRKLNTGFHSKGFHERFDSLVNTKDDLSVQYRILEVLTGVFERVNGAGWCGLDRKSIVLGEILNDSIASPDHLTVLLGRNIDFTFPYNMIDDSFVYCDFNKSSKILRFQWRNKDSVELIEIPIKTSSIAQ